MIHLHVHSWPARLALLIGLWCAVCAVAYAIGAAMGDRQ